MTINRRLCTSYCAFQTLPSHKNPKCDILHVMVFLTAFVVHAYGRRRHKRHRFCMSLIGRRVHRNHQQACRCGFISWQGFESRYFNAWRQVLLTIQNLSFKRQCFGLHLRPSSLLKARKHIRLHLTFRTSSVIFATLGVSLEVTPNVYILIYGH
jgi:hypothetical protein